MLLHFIAGLSLVLCVEHPSAAKPDAFVFRHDEVLGTSMELIVSADDERAARRAEGVVLREIDRLAAIFSNHDPSSEFRRWQSGELGSDVSLELIDVLAACDAWRERSHGAFDPRVQAFTRLWTEAARRDDPPSRAELDAAAASAAAPAWKLDKKTGFAERLSSVPLTLDGIAKGYIVERACAAATAGDPAVKGIVLNVGGDLRAHGAAEHLVAIAGPRRGSETTEPIARVALKDRALATSGGKYRGFQIQGRWYSHIIDPRTIRPAEGVLMAAVIAERSDDADALATILNVLPHDEGLRLADTLPGVACLIVADDGRIFRNAAWASFEVEQSTKKKAGVDAGPRDGWGDANELLVQFTINRPQEQGRYRRPYVGVWVEDSKGTPVRNLIFWVSSGGAGPFQWLPDLKRWHADVMSRVKTTKFDPFVIAQPTRPPGEYSVLWDGKDDKGNAVGPGEYTVLIEAVREQGGYGLIRKRVTLGDAPFVEDLKGNDEIKSAKLEYRKRGTGR